MCSVFSVHSLQLLIGVREREMLTQIPGKMYRLVPSSSSSSGVSVVVEVVVEVEVVEEVLDTGLDRTRSIL